jgi:hypothetical protein
LEHLAMNFPALKSLQANAWIVPLSEKIGTKHFWEVKDWIA